MVRFFQNRDSFHPGERDFFIDTMGLEEVGCDQTDVSIPANGIFLLIQPTAATPTLEATPNVSIPANGIFLLIPCLGSPPHHPNWMGVSIPANGIFLLIPTIRSSSMQWKTGTLVSIPANGIFLLIRDAVILVVNDPQKGFHPGERDFFIDTRSSWFYSSQ